MGKGQKSKRNRYVREIARNCEVAEDVYNGKIKYKRVHHNKYAGEEFKNRKKKNKNPVTIDNKIEYAVKKTKEEMSDIINDYNDKVYKINKRYSYIFLGLIILMIIIIFVIGVMNIG